MKPGFRNIIIINREFHLPVVFLFICLFIFISTEGSGQCVNPPTVTLSSNSGSTCGLISVTVNGNSFGSGATKVTITDNGNGTVTPTSATTSPFSFTYTPKSKDIGKIIIITVTTNIPSGSHCSAAIATYTLTINDIPSAPVVGTITQPSCAVATGSVVLSGLPATGTWTMTRTPGGVTTGTGTSTTISGIETASYTFKVSNSSGCTSSASANVIIKAQPAVPETPKQTVDCSLGSGKAGITVTSPIGSGLEYKLDIGTFQGGTSFTNVANGTHTITVRNSSGCTTTGTSFTVSCGCTNPPTVALASTGGSTCGITPVTISGNKFGGSATSVTITENGTGTVSPAVSATSPFAFTYTPSESETGNIVIITVTTNNPSGLPCTAASSTYILTVNDIPSVPLVGTIIQPTCAVATGSVVLSGLPANGTWTMTRTPGGVTTGTGASTTISGIEAASYTFKVSNSSGCISSASANVIIKAQPANPETPKQTVDCSLGSGKAGITVTSPIGSDLEYKLDTGAFQGGTSFTNVTNATHTITVRNSSGCTTTGTSFTVSCGCTNPPTVALASTGGSTCGTTPVTISGNKFGGSATSVTITENGTGTVSPVVSTTNPFAFSYTPSESETGNIVIITVTTNNPSGLPCTAASGTYILTVNDIPSAPVVGTITQPTCAVATGSVVLSGLPATGTWTLTRAPGGETMTGTGTSTIISGIATGTFTYTVTNATGCVSGLSGNVIISPQSANPTVPLVGAITQPTYELPTGSVVLRGLPESGSWILTRTPGYVTIPGIGINITITGLAPGTYTFAVTNASGCISGSSDRVVINAIPDDLLVVVTDPSPVCFPSTVDLTSPEITAGSTSNLTYTYWADAAAKIPYMTPTASTAGTYYIKGQTTAGFFIVKPVKVTIYHMPLANGGDDQFLEYLFETTMNAELEYDYESGVWSLISGTGELSDASGARTSVDNLSVGENMFLWAVTNGACPVSYDTVKIIVHDLVISTLITPNMDGRNDYFVLKELNTLGKTELTVFDRRGVQVYKNENYDNLWNGIDYKGNPLPDDTYFCIIKTENGKIHSGYIVIRR